MWFRCEVVCRLLGFGYWTRFVDRLFGGEGSRFRVEVEEREVLVKALG